MPSPRRRLIVSLPLLVAGSCLAGAVAAQATEQVFSLVVKDNKLVSGPKVIRLKRDDQVTLNILTDRADELHLHGYDLHLKLVPDQQATLKFVAKRTGRFGFELHKSGVELGVFEIYPK